MNAKGALGKALAAVLITYLMAVSTVANLVAHECGRFWFAYSFERSVAASWVFVAIGIGVYVICRFRHVGRAEHWWVWIAFAVIVLVANWAFATTVRFNINTASGEVQCAVSRVPAREP